MTNVNYVVPIALLTTAGLIIAGSPEDDQELPLYSPTIYLEDFQKVIDGTFDETPFTNVAESGTKKWFSNSYNENAYYEFSPFNSNEPLNVAWFEIGRASCRERGEIWVEDGAVQKTIKGRVGCTE